MFNLSFEAMNAKVVAMSLEDTFGGFKTIGRRRLYYAALNTRTLITKYPSRWPGKPKANLERRQINYLYFLIGRGWAHLPYIRTNRYKRSWKITRTPDGYILKGGGEWIGRTGMYVGAPYARFVGGDIYGRGQYWMHAGRWMEVGTAIDLVINVLPREVRKDLRVTAQRRGFDWTDDD